MNNMSEINFKTVLAETQETKRKSDLSNLAFAHVELSQALAEGQALLVEIEKAGENPTIPLEEIKRLYDKARTFGFQSKYR
jgi:hypothetical protein